MTYEYKRIVSQLGRLLTEPELNLLGSSGWQLIQVVGTTWYFMREHKPVRQTRKVAADVKAKQ